MRTTPAWWRTISIASTVSACAYLPVVVSLVRQGRVIHVSSFARSMFPALQLGYMLVPRPLRERFLAIKWLADRGSISMQQQVLAACITSGQYLRDLRRIAHRLAPRHRALHDALQARLGSAMAVTGSVAGGSLFMHLPRLPRSATGALIAEARARCAHPLCRALPPDAACSRHAGTRLSRGIRDESQASRALLAEAYLAVKKVSPE